MGAALSNLCMRVFTYANDVHIAIGSGFLGIILFIYHGMRTDTFRIFSVSGLTVAFMIYALSTKESVFVTPEKVIFITGCDSGLGYSLAEHSCELGLTVLAGCLNPSSDGAIKLARKFNNKIVIIEVDITDEDSVNSALQQTESFLSLNEPSELWAFINNAGVMVFGEFEWQTDRLIRKQIEINIYGTMAVTRAFLPLLRKYSGRVLNISSHCAQATLPGLSVYGASKSALSAWSDGLRVEMGKYGVSVVDFIPGSFVQQSNIMARQDENVFEMHTEMTEEQTQFYGEYFKEYNAYLSALSGERKPIKIQDEIMYTIFEQALLHKYPNASYIHESYKYKYWHILFRIAPWRVRDYLVNYFVHLPQWKPDRQVQGISVIG